MYIPTPCGVYVNGAPVTLFCQCIGRRPLCDVTAVYGRRRKTLAGDAMMTRQLDTKAALHSITIEKQ